MTKNNKRNLFVFEVGQSAIFKKKYGGKCFVRKNAKPGGGGSEGGLAKDQTFSGFSFVQPSLRLHQCCSSDLEQLL